MAAVPARTLRRLITGLTPIVLVAAALPLMAPTCGGLAPGVKTFSKGSLIIPMDVCYQCTLDEDTGTTGTSPSTCGQPGYVTPSGAGFSSSPKACPQATDPGNVIKAYGIVYQLIRAGIPVYWIINPAKANLDDVDLTVSFSGGPPVQRYDWNGGTGAAPTNGASIQYLGGPFVVDGSDFARAVTVLQANQAIFSSVKVHVSNVAFQGNVARTMAGGWSAGANIPPKLALLDIGSTVGSTTRNSEPVIRGYLVAAGLDFVGAGGTSSAGAHGQIYDRLVMSDFLPTTPGDWKTTRLYQNGYQILWVPHWGAPGSCSNSDSSSTCAATQYSDADVSATLQTIGAFVNDTTDVDPTSGYRAAGLKDVFAECAGLGSFDGVPGNNSYSPAGILAAQNATHFHTEVTPGFVIQTDPPTGAFYRGSFPSPLMQIGDFVFKPYSGAISTYRATDYKSTVIRLISEGEDNTRDVFSFVPGTSSNGTVVYMGGHSYETGEGTYQTAGVRLVLNSLFNLGANCIASGVTCSTGYLGICATGAMTCNAATGEPECTATVLPNAQNEICNGLDDNCNGLVDEGISGACYDGTSATRGVGLCHDGVRSCEKQPDGSYALGECVGDQLPAVESCNGLDDDCDGATDEALNQVCYDGPSNTIGTSGDPNPMCKRGIRTCTNGSYGACRICTAAEAAQPIPPADCQILPLAVEYCGGDLTGNGVDDNCDGATDENCGCSSLPPAQQTRACYTGPAGTAGNLPCTTGTQSCVANAWGPCTGQVLPTPEVCDNTIDDDCDGTVDDPTICDLCPAPPDPCYDAVAYPGTRNKGVCADGELVCTSGVTGTCGGVVGNTTFASPIYPSNELCDGLDNDCDDVTDEGADCGDGFDCINGLCVGASCGPEFPCPEGFTCNALPGSSGTCGLANCGTLGAPCPTGDRCLSGECVDPCASVTCGNPSICAGGFCTGVACTSAGCGSGLVCKIAGCTTDLCANVACPSGTFCREGDCIQACTFVTCAAGQRCGPDGFCVPYPCYGVTCPADRPLCDAETGACTADPCLGLSCGAGQMCSGGFCVDDPCAFIECPAGICYRGQCFPSGNPTGIGVPPETPPPPAEEEESGGGCGCGSGPGSGGLLLFGLLALPLARRRRQRPPGALLAVALAVGLTGLLAGCPKTEEEEPPPVVFDPSTCAETCGEQRCVSVTSDAAHCGQCDTPCDAGDICVDGMCGPGSAVAPYIRGLTPDSAGKGTATVPVTLTGDRFQAGATLRIIRPPPALPVTVPTTFVSSQQLQATLDLSSDPVQTVYLRVVNPDRVISPVAPFRVVPISPVVTSWTPSDLVVLVGPTPATLHATGTGLTTASQCHLFSRVTSVETVLPTENQTGTSLDCTLDTSGLSLGLHDLWVVNDGLLASAKSTLTVTSDALTITSLSPSSGAEDPPGLPDAPPVTVTVYGSGFNNTDPSRVYLSTTSGGSTFVAQVTTYVDPTRLLAQLDLRGLTAGLNYKVRVSNGPGEDSNLADFAIVSNPPTVTSVAFSPQPIYQNATETITFNGSNLTGGNIVIRKPDTTTVSPVTSGTGAQRTATQAFTPSSAWPPGSYTTWLDFGSSTSAPTTFTILSNVAILSAVSPAGGDQGTSPTLALTGANFFTGMKVFVLGLGLAGADVEVTPVNVVTANSATTGALSLVNRNTGVYRIVARNTGAADSNSLGFSVTPAVPSISGISVCTASDFATCTPATSVTQSATPIYLKVSGSNFAKPDVNGNGGSQLVAWNTGTDPDIASATTPINVGTLSGCTVTAWDYGSIRVTFDSRSVYATTSPYTLQVWNPGGATPPQKSGTTPFTVNP